MTGTATPERDDPLARFLPSTWRVGKCVTVFRQDTRHADTVYGFRIDVRLTGRDNTVLASTHRATTFDKAVLMAKELAEKAELAQELIDFLKVDRRG